MKLNFIKKNILGLLLFIGTIHSYGQFSIVESFKYSFTETNVVVGGNALLTAGTSTSETEGNGWLRLTSNTGNQAGYAYINQPFPSTQGLIVEFDYKTWGGNGADGFTVFLFDADYGPTANPSLFSIGAYGGSLGYSNRNAELGLAGAYIGVGFDEYGNFASLDEGKNGGAGSGRQNDFISIRGKATANRTNNGYKYYTGVKYTPGIAYTTSTTTRPTNTQFFRRVKIKIDPVIVSGQNRYKITVFVKNSETGEFAEHISYTTDEDPYPFMKVGFAASTGGSNNYHEIRNVVTTTPGGLRVHKSADKATLSTSTVNNANRITYTINVTNDSEYTLNNIQFTDVIQDVNGLKLTNNQFTVESISLAHFINNGQGVLTNNSNEISGTLALAPNKEGRITIVGTLKQDLPLDKLKNQVDISTNDIIDNDLSNNRSIVITDIPKPISASNDSFVWMDPSLQPHYSILANDTYNNSPNIYASGPYKNVNISTVGNWPAGITINEQGEIVIAPGTSRPTSPLTYRICNFGNVCQTATVSFTQPTGGGINIKPENGIVDGNKICYGNSVTIQNTSTPSGVVLDYIWQISEDNGATWEDLTSSMGATINSSTSVTLANVTRTIWIRRAAVYLLNTNYSNSVMLVPEKNEIIFNGQNSFSVAEGETFTLPTFTTTFPSTISIYRLNNSSLTLSPGAQVSLPTAGTYTYIVEAKMKGSLTCSVYSSIIVNVYSTTVDCTQGVEYVFPNRQSKGTVRLLGIPLGEVVNEPNALGADMSVHSNINILLSVLGIGTTWQNLFFPQDATAGTPVAVKIGTNSAVLSVLGGISVQAVDTNGNLVGDPQNVTGALLDLLTGGNVFEYKFIPLKKGVPIAYSGVRVSLGAAVGLGANVKVYGAYYQRNVTIDPNNCTTPSLVASGPGVTLNKSVRDVSWGTTKILGIVGALNGVLTPIVNPYHAVDDDINTFTTMNLNVAVAQSQILDVKLRKATLPGDEIRVILGNNELPILNLNLLGDFRVQRYMGDVKVGNVVSGTSFLLDLNLLGLLGPTGNRKSIIISSINQPFDRVQISYYSTVGVELLGNSIQIYDVSVVPNVGNNEASCLHETFSIDKLDCSAYTVSMAHFSNGNFVDIPNSIINSGYQNANNALYNFTSTYGYLGNLYVKIQMQRQGCEYGAARYIKVKDCISNDAIVNPVIKSGAN